MLRLVLQTVLVIMVILLTVAGLNVSNQGINQLTLEDRGPVLDIGVSHDHIQVVLAGDEYQWPWEGGKKLMVIAADLWNNGVDYLYKIWDIFNIVFLTGWLL
ncbi:hypothetical protein [Syntrophomonas erecta]